uniref:Uncharacterized protein n=1 Tax=Nelumbo nucifera TaxID=4432 RepID=A0A822XPJ8_NELNU|nr:TPA_asm: hypothetical protein HUJ06_023680 [Nelumbo nucifera]DAD22221.1 TPA_asm: hypothetical protein HUJ06_023684 [Nelumbo nucifera]DAD22223.1 TPA_asm: hypothetical protein HUJ06_023686 [Nelumbo nucifera]DAD22227.1 TPA_asm: hypothetical protein HUJ06_023690 [Nelumbo nucifera]
MLSIYCFPLFVLVWFFLEVLLEMHSN